MILQFLDLFHCCTTCGQLILLVVYNFQMNYWNLGTCNIAKKSQSAINKEKMMINCELEDWPPARTLTHCHYCGFWTFPLQWGIIIIIIIKWAHFQFWLQIKWFWLMPSVYFQHHSLMGPSRAAVHVGGGVTKSEDTFLKLCYISDVTEFKLRYFNFKHHLFPALTNPWQFPDVVVHC